MDRDFNIFIKEKTDNAFRKGVHSVRQKHFLRSTQYLPVEKDIPVEKVLHLEKDLPVEKVLHLEKDLPVEKDPLVEKVLPEEKEKRDAKKGREIPWLQHDFNGNDRTREQVVKLQQQLASSRRELIAERQTSSKFLGLISRLETKIGNTLRALQGEQEKQLQYDGLQSKIRSLENDIEVKKESQRQQYAKVDKLQEKLTGTLDELAQLKQKFGVQEESCTNLTKAKSDLETKFQELEQSSTKAKTELGTRITNLEAAVRKGEEEILRLKVELVNLQEKFDSETESRTVFTNEKKELELKVQELQSALGKAHASPGETERFLCQICMDRPRNALCMPCRHFACCKSCLKHHMENKKECPICRSCIKEVIECFT